MLHYSVTFFVIAIAAALLGFGGIAGSAIEIAKILFFVFLILSVVLFIFGKNAGPVNLLQKPQHKLFFNDDQQKNKP